MPVDGHDNTLPDIPHVVPEPCAYDYGLGVDPYIINYVRESMVVQSRISPMRCYLIQQLQEPDEQVGSADAPVLADNFNTIDSRFHSVIWDGNGVHPDTRPCVDDGKGAISVTINGNPATRVDDIADITFDYEYAVVTRKDLKNGQVELVFNKEFIATDFEIRYWYTELAAGVSPERLKSGPAADGSLYGWEQFIDNSYDEMRGRHQILVRMPLTVKDIAVAEEGKIVLKENQSWMIWYPYVRDFDILVVPALYSTSKKEERYEIVDKQDSMIQEQLVTQRFKIKYLEEGDERYKLPYTTEKVIT